MDEIMQQSVAPAPAPAAVKKVDKPRLMEIRGIHQKYVSGLTGLYNRVKGCEEWFRGHNSYMEQEDTQIGKDGGFTAQSKWVFNAVASKHADHVNACPESACLPREPGDVQSAGILSKVLPYIFQQIGWARVWDRTSLRKVKLGTGHYKVLWDKDKLGGLGDVAVKSVSTLNLAWQPTVTDIQESEYFFHHEYMSRRALVGMYPDKAEELRGMPAAEYIPEFLPDSEVRDKTGLVAVVECWYKLPVPTAVGTVRKVLHKILYVGGIILYASEDDPNCAQRGYYDHGLYPYVFDPMFVVEDSACGLGYVDIGVNPQTAIDILNTAMVKNAAVGALPRYMSSDENNVLNEKELLDTSKAIVHVKGSIDERILREIPHKSLDGNYIALRDGLIQEMRETTGNTETSTGSAGSGVTAASAIAALQEASGKISRASISASYEAFARVVEQVICLIRQFYTVPRYVRIAGEGGKIDFRQLSAEDLGGSGGSVAYDVIVKAQRMNAFDRVSHNELALQFYGLGFFNPQKAEEALMCIDMMDFPGKDTLVQKIAAQATMHKNLVKYMQLALTLAQRFDPAMAEVIGQEIMAVLGQKAGAQMVAPKTELPRQEAAGVSRARERAQGVSQPGA